MKHLLPLLLLPSLCWAEDIELKIGNCTYTYVERPLHVTACMRADAAMPTIYDDSADAAAQGGLCVGVSLRLADGESSVTFWSPVCVTDTTATVTWIAATENADGTPLTDLAFYTVCYWTDTVVICEATTDTWLVIEDLTPGVWWFMVKASDTSGNESVDSETVSKEILE